MGVKDPFDPEQNIAGGVGYLRRCLDRFGHNLPLAVAAYNAGPEAVARYATIPPYQETQLFVNNVLGSYGAQGGQAGLNSPAAGARAAAGVQKVAQVLEPKQGRGVKKEQQVRPRHKAKIIEVRSQKVRTKAIPILRD
jgi:soluble lytic murein transglycosylase-like protein